MANLILFQIYTINCNPSDNLLEFYKYFAFTESLIVFNYDAQASLEALSE